MMGHVLLKGKATLMKICLEQEQKNERQLREGWFVKIQSNSLTVLFLLKAKWGGGWKWMLTVRGVPRGKGVSPKPHGDVKGPSLYPCAREVPGVWVHPQVILNGIVSRVRE